MIIALHFNIFITISSLSVVVRGVTCVWALFFKQVIYLSGKMLNKNVADYTNFDGKTNKKIVQAPGGASSFSIGWSNEKTDYGPERAYKKKSNYPEEPTYHNSQDYQKQGVFNYNEPIRVMEEKPESYPRQEAYGMQQASKNYGG